MSLFLSKLLPVFVYPLGAAILLMVVAFLTLALGRRNVARAMLAVAIVGLWLVSTPLFANWLASRLETQYPPQPLQALPQADVAIVLGGVLSKPLPPAVTPNLGGPIDRVFLASRLYHAGKTGHILVSGGNLPWKAAVAPEAELIADLLVELGTPRTALTLETKSRNTHENAARSKPILDSHGWKSALLVTSGLHMPRALATFRRAGFDVEPAATDIRSHFPLFESALDLLPDAEALQLTSEAIKEIVGGFVYRLRGWA